MPAALLLWSTSKTLETGKMFHDLLIFVPGLQMFIDAPGFIWVQPALMIKRQLQNPAEHVIRPLSLRQQCVWIGPQGP